MPVGGTADRGVVTLLPVQEVVAALVAGAGPVRDLVPGKTGRLEAVVGDLVLQRLVVVVGGDALPRRHRLAERRARFDGQRVRADVGRAQRERGIERGLPVGDPLAGGPVDEVEVDPVDAGVAGPAHRALHVRGIVGASERGEHVGAHRLHPERHAVHSGRGVVAQLGRVDRVGIALDRDLGSRGTGNHVEDRGERVSGEE